MPIHVTVRAYTAGGSSCQPDEDKKMTRKHFRWLTAHMKSEGSLLHCSITEFVIRQDAG